MDKNKKNKMIGFGLAVAVASIIGGIAVGKKIKNIKDEKNLQQSIYKTGAVRKFGTFYLNGVKKKLPIDFDDFEDIPNYEEGNIEIRDTDRNDEYKLSWIEVMEDEKKLLICDRNILKNVSWNELNDQGLVYGKVVKLDGRKYILRLLTGGNGKLKSNVVSEWDKYIRNIDDILELPESTEADLKDATDDSCFEQQNGDSNRLWNWYKFCSFTQSNYYISDRFSVIRGFYSVASIHYANKEKKYDTIGYRPVLELLE